MNFKKLVSGTDFDTIEDAMAADLVSAIPFIGAISDFSRLIDSESRPQKALQALDMITSPIPLFELVTPTNTILYLNKKGMLPFEIEKIDNVFKNLLSKRK